MFPKVRVLQCARSCLKSSPSLLKALWERRRPFPPQGPWSVPMQTPVSVCPLCETVTLLLSPGQRCELDARLVGSEAPRHPQNDQSTGVAHTGLCSSAQSRGGPCGAERPEPPRSGQRASVHLRLPSGFGDSSLGDARPGGRAGPGAQPHRRAQACAAGLAGLTPVSPCPTQAASICAMATG